MSKAVAFISHAAEDKTKAVELAQKLETRHTKCWYFERDSVVGELHLTTTQRAISDTEVFILLISRASIESDFVNAELLHTAGCRKVMIPLYLDLSPDELSDVRPKWTTALGFSTGVFWTTSDEVVEKILEGIRHYRSGLANTDSSRAVRASVRSKKQIPPLHRLPFWKRIDLWKWSCLLHAGKEMRFVGSAFVQIFDKGKYFLVKNRHRPESVSPFGGVVKFKPEAKSRWSGWGFHPHVFGDVEDLDGDIRGFVPARTALSIVDWYLSGSERESTESCLRRELMEEFAEAQITCDPAVFARLNFRFVRLVFDGPEEVPEKGYWQFRVFEIFELDYQSSGSPAILDSLHQSTSAYGATYEEIHTGRGEDGVMIGDVTLFFFGKKRGRNYMPIYEGKRR